MHFPLILVYTLVLAPSGGQRAGDVPSAVRFSCDFAHYPPKGNVAISLTQCDVAIFADEHPHLRLTTAEKSRFVMTFSLPDLPKSGFLNAVHLASADGQGKCESPISVRVNGKPVVENWNVGPGGYQKTCWDIADKLQKGENTIEWRAGKLRTHYWLRKAEVEVAFGVPVEAQFGAPEVEHALFWEGRFDQCSYNALATVLDHFYGVEGWNKDRDAYQKRVFVSALDKFGLGAYYGWAPWTSYMVRAGTIRWNGHPVTDLKAERFSLRPKAIPVPQGREMMVKYEPGEKTNFVKELRARLEKGPVIIWTPYAAAMRGGQGHRASDGVDARPLEVLGRQGSEDAGHLFPHDLDQHQLLLQIPLVVGQSCDEGIGTSGQECRLVLGDHPFHPVGVDRLVVGDVADYLLDGPLAGNGTSIELFGV